MRMFSLAMDLMSVLLMSLRRQTCEICMEMEEKNTHTCWAWTIVRVSTFTSMASVQTFDVTSNKFDVYRIRNEANSYAHKKCANKQNNNYGRDFVAKDGRSTGKSASWILFRISLLLAYFIFSYLLDSFLLYFWGYLLFLLSLFLFTSFFLHFPFCLFPYFNPCCNLVCCLLIVSTYVISISRLTHLELLGTVRSTSVQVLWSVSKG